jgi:hypothetical protein
MMSGPLQPVRHERTNPGRGTFVASRGSASAPDASDCDAEQQEQIAAQRQAFNFEAAQRAEILREHEVLEALLMAHLKNEDEITKKWIALI